MPTLREVIDALPEEERNAFFDKIQRISAYRREVNNSPVLGRAGYALSGIAHGFANAVYGLATSPLALTNTLGLTDSDLPRKPLIGEGGYFRSDPKLGYGVGPFYGVGNVLGFAASFAGGAGEAKTAEEAARIAARSFANKAARGAASFAAGTALRSQGDVGQRAITGLEAAPLGAAFGALGRVRAAGESLPRYVFSSALRGGAAGAVASVVPGAQSPIDATGNRVIDNVLFNAAFGGAASVFAHEAPVPGRESTQRVTSPAAAKDLDLRARAVDMQRTVEEQSKAEQASAAAAALAPTGDVTGPREFAPQPTLFPDVSPSLLGPAEPVRPGEAPYPSKRILERYDLDPTSLIPQDVLAKQAAEARAATPPTTPNEIFAEAPPELKSPTAPSFNEKVDLLKSTGQNLLTRDELIAKAPELGGLSGVAQHLGLSGKGTTAELADRIASFGIKSPSLGASPTVRLNVVTAIHKTLRAGYEQAKGLLAPDATNARVSIESTVRRDLSAIAKALWPYPEPLTVRIMAPTSATPHTGEFVSDVAAFNVRDRTMTLHPRFFTMSAEDRVGILVHELTHDATIRRSLAAADPEKLVRLYSQLGFPAASHTSPTQVIPTLAEQAARQISATLAPGWEDRSTTYKNHSVPDASFSFTADMILPDGSRGPVTVNVFELNKLLTYYTTGYPIDTVKTTGPYFGVIDHTIIQAAKKAGHLAVPPIADLHYAYTHPLELPTELANALASGDSLRSRPAALELLDTLLGGRHNAFILGQSSSNALRRQLSLFQDFPNLMLDTPPETGGPAELIFKWNRVKEKLYPADQLASRRIERESPWMSLLFEESKKGPTITSVTGKKMLTTVLDAVTDRVILTHISHDTFNYLKRLNTLDRVRETISNRLLELASAKDAAKSEPPSSVKSLYSLIPNAEAKQLISDAVGGALHGRNEGSFIREEGGASPIESATRADSFEEAVSAATSGVSTGSQPEGTAVKAKGRVTPDLVSTVTPEKQKELASAPVLIKPGQVVTPETPAAKTAAAATRAVNTFATRNDPILNARLDSLFSEGLMGVLSNSALSQNAKKILIWKFGAEKGLTDADGKPVEKLSDARIAQRLGISPRTVRDTITNFANSGASAPRVRDKSVPKPLFEDVKPVSDALIAAAQGEKLPTVTRDATEIPLDDPTYDYTVHKTKIVQTDAATGERVAEAKRSRRGTGRLSIYDSKTKQLIGVQQGLFDNRRAAYAEADAEAARPEPPPIAPAPAHPSQNAIEEALGAVEQPLVAAAVEGAKRAEEKAASGGLNERPPEPIALFGDIAGAFKPSSRLGEIALYNKARAKIGGAGMTDQEFSALYPDQQLRHTILRLADSSDLKPRYLATLKKRAKQLRKAGQSFPTFFKLAKLTSQYRGANVRPAWLEAVRTEAARQGVHFEIVSELSPRGVRYRLTEPETGRQIVTRDVGAAALWLDSHGLRFNTAAELLPEGFSHFRLYVDPSGGPLFGPPPPPDAPTASDAEAAGRPPDIPEHVERSFGDAFFGVIRPTLNYAASVGRYLRDLEIPLSVRDLMDKLAASRRHAQSTIQRRVNLAKKFGVKVTRSEALGAAAADLDARGELELKTTKDLDKAIAYINSIQDAVYESHGLLPNEIAFLKAMRPEWDRLFKRFGIGITRYIPGYFTRWREPVATGPTVVIDPTFSTAVDFFARQYRKGVLGGQSYDYFKVFDTYARQGYREKYLGSPPSAGSLSPIERLQSAILRYKLHSVHGEIKSAVNLTDEAGHSLGALPVRFRPFVDLIHLARGIPDSRRLNAVEAQAGFTNFLYRKSGQLADSFAGDGLPVPFRKDLAKLMKRYHEHLGVKLSERTYNTLLDLFTRLHRGRTFGLHFGRVIRQMATGGPFFVMPRVGPHYFARAITDILHPSLGEAIFKRASALGVIKPAFYVEYISSTSRALNWIDKLSFMYSWADHWERMVAFRAQELKTQDALASFRKTGDIEAFTHKSGLSLLDPALHDVVLNPLKRGNYAAAVREHAKLLADIALFDYTNAGAPPIFRGVWGRFFGQYGIWPVNMVENVISMGRWGTRGEIAKVMALYAASAAATYGLGAAIGIKTAQWIPFIHNAVYTGGPGFSLTTDLFDTLSGNAQDKARLLSDLRHDPVLFFLSPIAKNLIPAGDTLRILASQFNMSRRRRRLLGVPLPESDARRNFIRTLGFQPTGGRPQRGGPLAQQLVGAGFEKLGFPAD